MPLNVQAEISSKIQGTLDAVKMQMPNGEMPHKEELADLKGIMPNPKTVKSVLACSTGVPSNFLADFDPLTSLVATIPIPMPKISIKTPLIDFEPKTVPELPEINTEGLDDKQIAELERKRALQQKANELKTAASNKIKGAAAGLVNKVGAGIQGQLQGGIEGAANNAKAGLIAGALGAPGVKDIMMKVAAFKFFKAQMAAAKEKIDKVKEKIDETKDTSKEVLEDKEGVTASVVEDQIVEKEKKERITLKEKIKNATARFKSKSRSGGSEPGSEHDSTLTEECTKVEGSADAFKANVEQTVKNVGSFLTDVLGTVKKLLGTILKIVGALMAILGLVAMLKQLMEVMMMLMFSKCNGGTGGASSPSGGQSPEQFLEGLGYPGFTVDDFSVAIQTALDSNVTFPPINPLTYLNSYDSTIMGPTDPNSNLYDPTASSIIGPTDSNLGLYNPTASSITKPTYSNSDLYEPIIIGGYQIGQPLTKNDLDIKDFVNHPLMGDLTKIHPQITNDLYNSGILPLPKDVKTPDPTQFEKELDKLYDQIVDELIESQNIEYIEKLYNLDFEMIGYKRYRA